MTLLTDDDQEAGQEGLEGPLPAKPNRARMPLQLQRFRHMEVRPLLVPDATPGVPAGPPLSVRRNGPEGLPPTWLLGEAESPRGWVPPTQVGAGGGAIGAWGGGHPIR